MQAVGCRRYLDLRPGGQIQIRIDAGDANVLIAHANGQVLLVAQLLAHHQRALETDLVGAGGDTEPQVLGTNTDAYRASDARPEPGKARARQRQSDAGAGE